MTTFTDGSTLSVWDLRFLKLAKEVASWSKDPSTKVGAIAVDPDRRIISTGYNGFPKGIQDTDRRLCDRDYKYRVIIHAEQNMILNKIKPLKHTTIYTWPMGPCPRCAVNLIQCEVAHVISAQLSPGLAERWGKGLALAAELYSEAGIIYKEIVSGSK